MYRRCRCTLASCPPPVIGRAQPITSIAGSVIPCVRRGSATSHGTARHQTSPDLARRRPAPRAEQHVAAGPARPGLSLPRKAVDAADLSRYSQGGVRWGEAGRVRREGRGGAAQSSHHHALAGPGSSGLPLSARSKRLLVWEPCAVWRGAACAACASAAPLRDHTAGSPLRLPPARFASRSLVQAGRRQSRSQISCPRGPGCVACCQPQRRPRRPRRPQCASAIPVVLCQCAVCSVRVRVSGCSDVSDDVMGP